MPRESNKTSGRDALQTQLAELAALHKDRHLEPGDSRQVHRQSLLSKAVLGKSSFAVAAAAELLEEFDRDLLRLLPEVFSRFMRDPLRDDKGCTAKAAIARALERVESQDDRVFRTGLFYVQLEPVYGGRQDTAVELRSICAIALARLSPSDVLDLLAELLCDPEHGARAAAARAIGCSARDGAGSLLRYKSLSGDAEPTVLTECLFGLLQLEGKGAIPFVRRFLEADAESKADAAALALGQSRLPQAIPVLKEYAENPPRIRRRTALVALAMLRIPEATDYLLQLAYEADCKLAVLAVEALGIHRYDELLRNRLAELGASRKEPLLAQAIARALGRAV